ncbi:MAG TPA: M24 family metallopeptidase, partial [Bryobacteraceae bacterium]|nr:M24 family metallopeptidase [Bryobacteraceae bacterium]
KQDALDALSVADIIGIDIGLKYKGWCGDACVTYAVGAVSPQAQRLLDVAHMALDMGIRAAQSCIPKIMKEIAISQYLAGDFSKYSTPFSRALTQSPLSSMFRAICA